MSELSTRIRKLVDDPTISEVYGAWGTLQPIQRKQIRELCDTCDNFESTADSLYYTLLGVMHSVDKWLDDDELKQPEVNRAATMREKTLQIVEGQAREIARLQQAVSNSLPSGVQACSEEEAMKIGYERGRADATSEIFAEIDEAIRSHYHSYKHERGNKSLIVLFNHGARTSLVTLKRDIDELRKKYTNGGI